MWVLTSSYAHIVLIWGSRCSAAYRLNSAKEFDDQPPVYAVLTDMKDFYFLRYDGSNFAIYENEINVSNRSRSIFLDGMRNGEHFHSPFDISALTIP